MAVRIGFAALGVGLALASAAWIDPAQWATYAVFFGLAVAFSFVWLDSALPASVAHMATANAFVYFAGPPVLLFELMARVVAYPVLFAVARRGWMELPRPLRPLVQADSTAARRARIDLAAMLGLASVGSVTRIVVAHAVRAAGVESLIAAIAIAEPVAYGVMGLLSAVLPLPTKQYVVSFPHWPSVEDERVDVIVATGLVVPYLVVLIVYGWLAHGLIGAAAWSVTTLPPHLLVGILVRRRRLLDERGVALGRANASLAAKHTEIEQFTYTVAHDVKAPLSGITMIADGLLEKDLPEPVRADVARVLRIAGQTENMVADLLRMVRIVSEPEAVGAVDLGVVTAEAVAMLQPQVTARGTVVDVAAGLPTVSGQATKLRHVVSNLVGNAIRFVPAESGRIGVSAEREGAAVVLAVRDNGIGVPAEYHRAIFEVFKRVPGAGDAEGSGMGLAIVKRIVEAHGGAVWVESEGGRGSVFRVRLPG